MIMMALSQSSSSSSASGGVGMSRAAKKRAKGKKRKESSQTITETDETTVTVTETHNNNNYDATSKTRKNCSETNTTNIKDDYEKQRQKISIKTKKKKMKLLDSTITTDNSNFEECNDEQVSVKNVQNNNNDNDEEGGILELHGLENMLLSATLTPRQILLLDDTAGVTTSNDDNDGDDQGRIGEIQIIGNCNPLMSEIATQHRARILLASLLSPSGVSVNDFYDMYWGKQPLVATYRSKSNSITSNFTHANDDDDCNDDDDDEEEEEEDRITSINKGQNKEKGKILHTEQSKPIQGGKGGGTVNQLAQQHFKEEHYHKQHTTRLDGFLTRSIINDMMSKNKLRYGLDLNVTRYTDIMGGKKNGQFGRQRITLDPPPKKREKKKKKLLLSSSNSNGDEDDKFNSNYDDDDVEYIIANPTDVWTNVDTASCTLRLLRPHEHNDDIHTLLSLLEVEFGCMVGSNAYLTPLHSQGFAPHYDDVDVFICQLEGYKRWRVYSPMSKRETLPRLSSRDYTEKEMIDDMELVLDVMLGPGDVLYMPRGWIHQAETVSRPTLSTASSSSSKPQLSDKHSLHLTISAMQNWCWADYLEVLMPVALESATVSDKSTSLREGLPRNFLNYMGTMHQMDDDEDDTTLLPEGLRQAAKAQQDRAMLAKSNQDQEEEEDDNEIDNEKELKETRIIAHERQCQQRQFKEEAKKRIMRVCKQAMSMLDDACDEIGKRFLSDRLPPALLRTEACLTKEGGSNGDSSSLHHHQSQKIWPNTLCRIVRPDIARLVVEDSKAVLYHCLDNSRVYHGTPLSPMEFEIDDAPALEQLLTTVEPHWIMVKDLIHGDLEDKMEIAQTLFNEGILATMLVNLPDRSVKTG